MRGVRYEKTLILRKLKGIQPPKTRVQKKAPAVNQLEPLKGLSNYLRKESLPLSNALILGTSRAGWPGMPISFNLGLRGASDRNQLPPGSTLPCIFVVGFGGTSGRGPLKAVVSLTGEEVVLT